MFLKSKLKILHTSPFSVLELGFQHNMRLSLPQDKSKSGSCGHQAIDKTPLGKKGKIFKLQYAITAVSIFRFPKMLKGLMENSKKNTNHTFVSNFYYEKKYDQP